MRKEPVGFMSYVRFDDQHEGGRLTEFCKRLAGEVRMQTGESFHIFQDRNDIAWGEQWQQRIEESIDAVTFLIPILTPAFFRSPPCRQELERFLDREKRLGRGDLILPVYYVNCSILNNEASREADALAKVVAGRQYADWRELRFEPLTSPEVGKTLAKLAGQISEALGRSQVVSPRGLPLNTAVSASESDTESGGTTKPSHQATADQSTEAARRPAQKPEPPTLVVDALHRGDHSSLTDALAAAKPGDRILVRAGFYREGVVIDKPVEIVGDGEVDEVVIEATGKDTILFQANMGRLANLTLRQAGEGRWYCVDITQGRPDLEGCDVSSQSLACVAIHEGADPRLRRNRIHDGKAAGVFIYEDGRGTLEDNEIFGNSGAGVEIAERSNPTVRRNRIHDGKHAGISVYLDGQGTLEDNEIVGNALAGVSISNGGNPTLRRNRIHDGKQGGVLVYENGQGFIEDNDIFANVSAGVEVTGGSNPTLLRNRIHDGMESGVYVHQDGQGTFEDNEIFGNAKAGVSITTGADPTLRRNRIHSGKQGGVYVYKNGRGILEGNEISNNTFSGIEVKTGGDPTLRRNRIYSGKQGGVYVHENGRGTLEDNEIVGNARAGVRVSERGNPTLRRNRIYENRYEAIWVNSMGEGTFEDNDLRGNARGAWDIAPECEDKIIRNRNRE
jgi:parallel beta-helix repeat protein